MNDVMMNESLVFDACALVEEIADLRNSDIIKEKAVLAARLLNRALEESQMDRN